MTIGNRIACYRKQMNITQEKLAQQLQVTNQAVSKWESDQCCPDVMLLPRIADIFGVSIDALFGRANAPQPQQIKGLPWKDDGVLRVCVYIGHELLAGGLAERSFQYRTEQSVEAVISAVSVTCGDVRGDVNGAGNVSCGNVGGDVDAGRDVNCGNVEGNVDAGRDINCGNVEGNVDAGADVICGNVEGDVDAGVNVNCGNVDGDVDAGCNVECGSVAGAVDAGMTVTIKK